MIRPARKDDLPALMLIEQAAPSAAHWNQAEYEKILSASEPPHRSVLVAEENGKVAGFIVAKTGADEWEIENIAVDAQLQRHGIGLRLVQSVIKEARQQQIAEILLEVRSSNSPARMLYAKCGFSITGRRRNYYRNPVDEAIQYKLKLFH